MTKKHFIELADAIRFHNQNCAKTDAKFTAAHLSTLATFCEEQNSNFNLTRWLDYIEGKCGPSGGRVG